MNRRRFLNLVVLGSAGLLAAGRVAGALTSEAVRRLRIRLKPLRNKDLHGPCRWVG
jgi:hypothetical protein